ncbi:hypothetical protein LVD13_01910 [Flavobacteriaceae bacterium D16]|nr:hypothetical protein [Flavobacteriaceae bacterium D16]
MKSLLIILVTLIPFSLFFSDNTSNSNITPASHVTITSDFNGVWVNEDEQTRATTQCKIRYENNRFIVQMWGKCHPEDCDWGENASKEVYEGVEKFELLWEHGFADVDIIYEMVDGKLKMTNNTHYKDNSGREDYTLVEYLIKQ